MDNSILVVFMFIGAVVSAIGAAQKQRNVVGWAFAGLMFPLIAIIAVFCLPRLDGRLGERRNEAT